MDIMAKIASSILTTLYQAFFYAFILAVAVSLVYKKYPNVKSAIKDWIKQFKSDSGFRKVFFLVLYSVMILFRTLLNRNMWANPVSNVFGVWGLYNESGELTTEVIENFILFIPFSIILLHILSEKIETITRKPISALWYSTKTAFLFSAFIEFTQLFLRLGTFQLSDFFYNTLGGFTGGLLYFLYLRIREWFE